MVRTSLIPKYSIVPTAEQIVEDLNRNLPPHVRQVTLLEIEDLFELADCASSTPTDFLRNINWLICLTYDRHCD